MARSGKRASGKAGAEDREPTMQMGIRLPPDMHAKLEAAGSKAGHGIGKEIRDRLTASLAMDESAVETQRLLEVLRQLLAGDFSPWHSSPALFKILCEQALPRVLHHFAPQKDSTGLMSGAIVSLACSNPDAFAEVAVAKAISKAAAEIEKRKRTE